MARSKRGRRTASALAIAIAGAISLVLVTGAERDDGPLGGGSLFKGTSSTRPKVQRMLGGPPDRCTSSSPELWVCTWVVAPDADAYALLAAGAENGRPIHFVCRFPEPLATAAGQCTSHRSVPLQPTEDDDERAAQDELARRAIDEARTLEALSLLLGAGPDDCLQRDERDWVCYWRTAPEDPGFITLGALTDGEGAARLICLLPLDGGERGEESCRITRE